MIDEEGQYLAKSKVFVAAQKWDTQVHVAGPSYLGQAGVRLTSAAVRLDHLARIAQWVRSALMLVM